MNKHLQSILNFIQKDKTTSVEEKNALLKAVDIQNKEHEIEAALERVRTQINKLPDFKAEKPFKPKVSIGIKSGEMISGNIGSETLRRLDYTVIGDTVNTAARLENAAGENQIVISEDCYEQIKESFVCEKLGSIKMKNKANPVNVYAVIE